MKPALLFALGALVAACGPPDADCASELGGYVEGPARVSALIADPEIPLETQVAAARSLLDSPRRDIYAPAVVAQAVGERDPAGATALAEALLPWIDAGLGEEPSARGARAVDLLVGLSPALADPDVDPRLAAWFSGGAGGIRGRHSAAEIYAARGLDSIEVLLAAVETPFLPRPIVATLVEIGPALAPEPIAAHLLESEAATHTDAFEDYLRAQIAAQLEELGEPPDPNRVERATLLNRDELRADAVRALRSFNGEAPVVARLVERVRNQALDAPLRLAALESLEGALNPTAGFTLLDAAVTQLGATDVNRRILQALVAVPEMAEPAYDASSDAPPEVWSDTLRLALVAEPERYINRLLDDGLPPGPYELSDLRSLGDALEGRLSPATLERLMTASDPHFAVLATTAGGDSERLSNDTRSVNVRPTWVRTVSDAAEWRPGAQGEPIPATEAERDRTAAVEAARAQVEQMLLEALGEGTLADVLEGGAATEAGDIPQAASEPP